MTLTQLSTFLENKFYKHWIKPKPADFSSHWSEVLKAYWWQFLLAFLLLGVDQVIQSYTPFVINNLISLRDINYLWWLVIAFGISALFSFLGFIILQRVELQVTSNLDSAISNFALTIDPINHTTKSSGTIIAKYKRTVGAVQTLMTLGVLELPTKLIAIMISIGYIYSVNWIIGTITLLLTVSSISLNFWYINNIFKPVKTRANASDDVFVNSMLENISQAQLIRASFATKERTELLGFNLNNRNIDQISFNLSFSTIYQITRIILLTSILVTSYMIYTYVVKGEIQVGYAMAIITSYSMGTYQLIFLGSQLSILLKSASDTEDFYEYINELGKQSYPVL
jgi:ABC-type multidrug transport system fused ATPase/permease subunit